VQADVLQGQNGALRTIALGYVRQLYHSGVPPMQAITLNFIALVPQGKLECDTLLAFHPMQLFEAPKHISP
jgi:hypothetical protein